MARRRPTYSPEFKAEAVRLVRTSSGAVKRVPRSFVSQLGTLGLGFDVTCPPAPEPLTTDERTELKQLRRDIRRVREERDILKKATAFFAKQSE